MIRGALENRSIDHVWCLCEDVELERANRKLSQLVCKLMFESVKSGTTDDANATGRIKKTLMDHIDIPRCLDHLSIVLERTCNSVSVSGCHCLGIHSVNELVKFSLQS